MTAGHHNYVHAYAHTHTAVGHAMLRPHVSITQDNRLEAARFRTILLLMASKDPE